MIALPTVKLIIMFSLFAWVFVLSRKSLREKFVFDPTLLIDSSTGRVVVTGHSENKQYILGLKKEFQNFPRMHEQKTRPILCQNLCRS
jgi:hypothetical protein